ncbi:MAG: type II toxin-antitoxin system RelE/ParE family toxin [Actinomycetota bacterium]|nr:type II toxin-antitoxin system RelE/ParE family toxin [Actinomycetota bacterium]
MKVVWSKRARRRVTEIARYIAQDSPQASGRWVDEIFETVEALGDFPSLGKPGRDVATPGIRELVFGDFRVFYEVGTDVDVLTVRRASQLVDEDEFTSRD